MKFRQKNRMGMVLILTFIIMTTLIAVVIGFIYLTSAQLKSSGHDTVSQKALWLAEAGLQKAIRYLQVAGLNGTGGSITTVAGMTESLGDGSYTIIVTQPVVESGSRIITSTGTAGVISRTITQTVTVRQPYLTGYGVTTTKNWDETS